MLSRQQNSYVPLQGKDTFQTMDELSKENYHFALSEALLSVIEEVSSLLLFCTLSSSVSLHIPFYCTFALQYKATLLEQGQEDHFSSLGSCDSPPVSSPLKKGSLFADPVWDSVDTSSPVGKQTVLSEAYLHHLNLLFSFGW